MTNIWSVERIRAFEQKHFAETKTAMEHANAALHLASLIGQVVVSYPETSPTLRELIGSTAICLITFSARVDATPAWDESESHASSMKEAYAALLGNLSILVHHSVYLDSDRPFPGAIKDKTVTALLLACAHLDKMALFSGTDLQTAIDNVMTANAGEFEA